jgi:hypothetical protein
MTTPAVNPEVIAYYFDVSAERDPTPSSRCSPTTRPLSTRAQRGKAKLRYAPGTKAP